MFEATVTHVEGFPCCDSADKLGLDVMRAPQIDVSKEEMMTQLGYLKD